MAKKGLIIGLIAVGAAALAVVALSKKGEAAPPPPTPKYSCIFGDGFATDTWAEMFQHYSTVHPEAKILDAEIKWL